MDKPDLPLRGTLPDGSHVLIENYPVGHLTQLTGWADFLPAATAALASLGVQMPLDYQKPTVAQGVIVWRIAPDRVLVQTQAPFAAASTDDLVMLDLSDARICLRLTGTGAAALLSRTVAIDLSPTGFPADTFVQTGMHKIGLLIQRHIDGFDVFVPITWSASVLSHLAHHLDA